MNSLVELRTDITTLHSDNDRLWQALREMAKLGASPKGGVNRQALTDLERQGRDLAASACSDTPRLTVSVKKRYRPLAPFRVAGPAPVRWRIGFGLPRSSINMTMTSHASGAMKASKGAVDCSPTAVW